jgi:hypothetical protein
VFICIIKQTQQTTTTMKKLITNSNPFALLVIPVLFAMIIGVSYQVKQANNLLPKTTYTQTTSLFDKSIHLFKAVCSISKEKVW